MSTKEELMLWQGAVDKLDSGDVQAALYQFQSMETNAKILYNIAIVHIKANEWNQAIVALNRAIAFDNYLAIAYFLRARCMYKVGQSDAAVEDYDNTLLLLRGNDFINYHQLGLNFILRKPYILNNKIIAILTGAHPEDAGPVLRELESCESEDDDPQLEILKRTLRAQMRADELSDMVQLDYCHIFRPPESKMQNIDFKDYVGSSTVVASVDASDTHTGFSGTALKTAISKKYNDIQSPIVEAPFQQRAHSTRSARRTSLPPNVRVDLPLSPQMTAHRVNSSSSPQMTANRLNSPVQIGFRKSSLSGNNTRSHVTGSSTAGHSGPLSATTPGRNDDGFHFIHSPIQETGGFSRLHTTIPTGPTIHVKVHHKVTRIVLVPLNVSFLQLYQKIMQKMHATHPILLKFKDTDGELCALEDDEDLYTALLHAGIDVNATQLDRIMKMDLWCVDH